MENYLVNNEVLGEVVDGLIATKYPGHPTEIYAALREESIGKLDDKIASAIFSNLTHDQLRAVEKLLDDEHSTMADFEQFFASEHIDLGQRIQAAIDEFSKGFLGDSYDK